MKHFGDITKIDGHSVPIVDIITAGSPCQDLSIAGKRDGLAGERSGLFMEQIRVIKEMHDECRRTNQPIRPRFQLWENVPGAFSSNDGEDFRVVLEETARVADPDITIPRLPTGEPWSDAGCILADGWSIAWRVTDAQFFGVPQRRRRIALVADFGGQTAPEILFERKGLSRNNQPSGEEGQGTSETPQGSSSSTNYTVKIRGGSEHDSSGRSAGKGALIQKDISGTLSAVQDQTLFQDIPTVYGISPFESNSMKSDNPNSGIYEADTARTLDPHGENPTCNQGGMMVLEPQLMTEDHFGDYHEGDNAASLRKSGGTLGGGGESIVIQSAPCVQEISKE